MSGQIEQNAGSAGTSGWRILRRISAIVAGLLAGVVPTLGMDVVLHASGIFPPWGEPMSDALFGLATAYRLVFCIFGSYVAAWLAPDRPMAHALVLGVMGFAVSAAGAAAAWNAGPAFGPRWYSVGLVVTALPCAWIGGWIYVRRSQTVIRGCDGGQK